MDHLTTSLPTIVLGSRNRKKSAEIAELLAPHGIQVTSVAEFADVPEVEEDGATFAENAAKKASETARFLKCWVLAEDSGLSVDALNGAPGVYSARFSGAGATDASNNARLIEKLADVDAERRTAHYVCNAALADPEGKIRLQVEATCDGQITTVPAGTNGFGYDPYFLIPEYGRTFGQLDPSIKQKISHRAQAFQQLIPQIVELFQRE